MKKLKVIILPALAVAIFTATVFKIYSVNSKYPQPQSVTVGLNESIEYNGYKLTALSSEFKSAVSLVKQGYTMDDDSIFDGKMVLLLKLSVQNVGDHPIKTSFLTSPLQSDGWSNSMDLDLFYQINNAKTVEQLYTASEYTVTLPFGIIPQQFTDKQWQNITNRSFSLVLSTYPEIRTIKCN